MSSNGLVDEQLDMLCAGFFDNIDDLLDFSADDEAFGMVNSSLDCSEKSSSGCRVTTNSENNNLYDNNISEDWISKFLGDTDFEIDLPSNDAIMGTSDNDYMDKEGSLFQSFSPISVLESSNLISSDTNGSSCSSSSSSNSVSLAPVGPTPVPAPAKARTNRPRRPSQAVNAMIFPKCDNIVVEESSPIKTVQKKRKMGIVTLIACTEDATSGRKCLHCGLQETPQWRAGPMGPKTLCNACGVRYRSGRLYPEYRPAASPTFVPALHSNSHKRVVEMRNKAGQKDALKNCDLLEYIRRGD